MPFDYTFYKNDLLNRLGEYKDRAAAALKALDSVTVKLKLYSQTTNDTSNMPLRDWTKVKSKHSHSYEREYKRRGRCPIWTESDSDDECYCPDCCPPIPRRPRRPVFVDGHGNPLMQNINQQNINIAGRDCVHNHDDDSDDEVYYLPTVRTLDHWPSRRGRQAVVGEDGKIQYIDVPKFLEHAKGWAEEVQKQKEKEEEARQKKIQDTADLVNQLLGSGRPRHSGRLFRSAKEIQAEIDAIEADKRQIMRDLQGNHVAMLEEDIEYDQLAMCSGALQDGDERKPKKAKKTAHQLYMVKAPKPKREKQAECCKVTELDDCCSCPDC